MGRACSTYLGEERCIRILVVKPEERSPLGRPKRRWEEIIKHLREFGWGAWTKSIWLMIGTHGELL
jgi:hypothetical protein